VVLAYVA
jgi:DNA-binding transcriptional regulator YdaS (Cro superfamily)